MTRTEKHQPLACNTKTISEKLIIACMHKTHDFKQ